MIRSIDKESELYKKGLEEGKNFIEETMDDSEIPESDVNTGGGYNNQEKEEILKQGVGEFLSEKVSSNGGIAFLKKLKEDSTNPENLKKYGSGSFFQDFKKFIKDNNPEVFSGDKDGKEFKKIFESIINDIEENIKKSILKEEINIESTQNELIGTIQKEYLLSNGNPIRNTNIIKKGLSEKGTEEIVRLIKTERIRKNFVEGLFSKDSQEKFVAKEKFDVFKQKLVGFDFNDLNDDKKEKLYTLYERIFDGEGLEKDDIKTIFNIICVNDIFVKLELLQFLAPSFTLADAISFFPNDITKILNSQKYKKKLGLKEEENLKIENGLKIVIESTTNKNNLELDTSKIFISIDDFIDFSLKDAVSFTNIEEINNLLNANYKELFGLKNSDSFVVENNEIYIKKIVDNTESKEKLDLEKNNLSIQDLLFLYRNKKFSPEKIEEIKNNTIVGKLVSDDNIIDKVSEIVAKDLNKNIDEYAEQSLLSLDSNGKITPDFKEKLKGLQYNGLQKTKNIDSFQEGSYVRYKFNDKKTGETHTVQLHILKDENNLDFKDIPDFAKLKKLNVDVFNLVDGKLDKQNFDITYDDLYRTLSNQDIISVEVLDEEEVQKDLSIQKSLKLNDNFQNLDDFNKMIDLFESKEFGSSENIKFTPGASITFKTTDIPSSDEDREKGNYIYSATVTDNNKIFVRDSLGRLLEQEPITFEQFYNEYEKKKCKRLGLLNTQEDLLEFLKTKTDDEIAKKFDDFSVLNGKFVNKEKEDFDFFVGTNHKGESQTVRVKSINGNVASIEIGLISKENAGKKEIVNGARVATEMGDNVIFKVEEKLDVDIKYLFNYIETFKCKPKQIDPEKIREIESKKVDEKPGIKSNLLKSFLTKPSLSDYIKGFKGTIDGLKEYLDGDSQESSMEIASKIANFLPFPDDIKASLESRAEDKRSSLMNKKAEEWKRLPNAKRIKQIEKVLLNKNAKFYEIQAAMLVALEKYGTLYPGDMAKHENKLMWYTAFSKGARDLGYYSYRKSELGEGRGGVFHEIRLVEEYCIELGKRGIISQNFPKKILSTFGKGFEDEKKAGEAEANGKFNIKEQVDGAFHWLIEGEPAKSLGYLQPIFEKGGSKSQINEYPFILAMGGFTEKMPEAQMKYFRDLYYKGYPCQTLIFLFSGGEGVDEIKKLKKAVVLMAKSIKKKDYDKNEGTVAEQLNGLIEEGKTYSDRGKYIKKFQKFWKMYGNEMVDKMNMMADPQAILEKEENKAYNDYTSTIVDHYQYISFNDGQIQDHFRYGHSMHALVNPALVLGKACGKDVDVQNGRIKGKALTVYKEYFKGAENLIKMKKKFYEMYPGKYTSENDPKIKEDIKKIFFIYNKGVNDFVHDKLGDARGFLDQQNQMELYNKVSFILPYKREPDGKTSIVKFTDDSGKIKKEYEAEFNDKFESYWNGVKSESSFDYSRVVDVSKKSNDRYQDIMKQSGFINKNAA